MPIHFHSHPYINNRPLSPHFNAGTSPTQTPAHPLSQSNFRCRHSHAPPLPQGKGSGYYFHAPLNRKDHICHQTVPQHIHHVECEHSLYMKEQWRLARPGKPSLISQHNTRSALLAAKEQRLASFGTLLLFLISLMFGSEATAEEETTPEELGQSIMEIFKNLFGAIFQLTSTLLRYSMSAIYQGIKRVDWNRVCKIVAMVYIAWIWGMREEKRLERLGGLVRGGPRAVSGLNGEGAKYFLVEDRRGWSTSVWDVPGI